ncbi:hypothetical protein NK8_83900 (plasmid) [Caballeronia sp. NK8]|nr:hypothetical protein NK8_83900 [Caballeronia sp. NK8]
MLVLTALVLTYGPVLFGSDFALVLEQIAECGAVVLLQQVVFADMGGMGAQAAKTARIADRLAPAGRGDRCSRRCAASFRKPS